MRSVGPESVRGLMCLLMLSTRKTARIYLWFRLCLALNPVIYNSTSESAYRIRRKAICEAMMFASCIQCLQWCLVSFCYALRFPWLIFTQEFPRLSWKISYNASWRSQVQPKVFMLYIQINVARADRFSEANFSSNWNSFMWIRASLRLRVFYENQNKGWKNMDWKHLRD